jgi:DNA-binding MarR family transcriptional regulator
MISLTAAGLEFVAHNLPIINRLREQIIHGLSQAEIRALKTTLDKIRNNLVS